MCAKSITKPIPIAVSPRGQLTLPASIRKRLGLHSGGMVIVEERDGVIRIQPAAVVGIELYADERMREFVDAEELAPQEFDRIRSKIKAAAAKRK